MSSLWNSSVDRIEMKMWLPNERRIVVEFLQQISIVAPYDLAKCQTEPHGQEQEEKKAIEKCAGQNQATFDAVVSVNKKKSDDFSAT